MTDAAPDFSANRADPGRTAGKNRSPGARLIAECRDHLVRDLAGWLQEVAAPIAEELFVLADSCRERLQQTRYLDLRADIEKTWPVLADGFRRHLFAETERCQNQATPAEKSPAAALEIPDFQGLELVSDDALSEHIVIREFSAQLTESCDEELYALNRRIAALLGQDESTECANPLSPAIVCQALSDACTAIGPDAEKRLLLLRRLERHLHRDLPGIYQQLNAFLIGRGILPDLKRIYRRTATGKSPVTDNDGQNVARTANTPDQAPSDIPGLLQRLARTRSGLPTGSSGLGGETAGANGAQLSRDETDRRSRVLLSSLDEIQHAAFETTGDVPVNQVRQVRDSENGRQAVGLEAVTLDIVAMLFDFIFDDAQIPLAVKALISRLQIPVLKVAMRDPGFFSDRQHPTRRFLGSVSNISIRWGHSVDEADPFYQKLSELVERIQTDFAEDVGIFGTALEALEAFVTERQGEEEQTTQAAARVVIRHEEVAERKACAEELVQRFRAENTLVPLVDDFLATHWTTVMQSLAEEDSDEAAWQLAADTMKALAWSITPKKLPEERLKLVGLLPDLLTRINRGLDRIPITPAQRSTFFDGLMKCHAHALKGETPAVPTPSPAAQTAGNPVPQPDFSAAQEGDLSITRSVDHGVEIEEIVLVGAAPRWRADDLDIYGQVSELQRGDWVEFHETGPEGAIVSSRERINWISPQRGILLFSNHRSAKAISITPDALARQIRDGKAAIVRAEPIFERALSGALETLGAA